MVTIEVEVLGYKHAPQAPPAPELIRAASCVLEQRGVDDGHLAIAFVPVAEITELNATYRDRDLPTDVLSFPIDERDAAIYGPRELGDVVICAEYTADITEAVVHGVLHLTGMDHECDDGEMLALQDRLMDQL